MKIQEEIEWIAQKIDLLKKQVDPDLRLVYLVSVKLMWVADFARGSQLTEVIRLGEELDEFI